MTNDPYNEKWNRPLGLAADGKTMNVFPSLAAAQEHTKQRMTVIVVDEDGNEVEMPNFQRQMTISVDNHKAIKSLPVAKIGQVWSKRLERGTYFLIIARIITCHTSAKS